MRGIKNTDTEALVVERVTEAIVNEQPIDYEKICEGLSVSHSTFYRILARNGLDIRSYNKETKEKVNSKMLNDIKEKIIDNVANSVLIDANKEEYAFVKTVSIPQEPEKTKSGTLVFDYVPKVAPFITASLISKRHDNVDTNAPLCIYTGPIMANMIHDYDKLYEIAYKFIKTNVVSNGIGRLKVFVTGLTQCVVAVIKAAIALDITLVLLHYDNATGKYKEQLVTGKQSEDQSSLLDVYAAVKKNYKIKLLKHNSDYFDDKKHLYIIKVEPLATSDNTTVFVTDDMQLMFAKAGEECDRIQSSEYSYRVIADEIGFGSTDKEFKFLNSFISYYNKEKE